MTDRARQFELSLLPQRFAVSRFSFGTTIPSWITKSTFFSVTRTEDELSIVSEAGLVPRGVQSQPGWRALRVHGPFAFSEVGVLAELTAALAKAEISLFAVSTFDTDYLLVSADQLAAATTALTRAGHIVHRRPSE